MNKNEIKKEIDEKIFMIDNINKFLLRSKKDYKVLFHLCGLHNDLSWLYSDLDNVELSEYHSEKYHSIYKMILTTESYTQRQKNEFLNYIN
jgi:hypothetical protein